MAQEIELTREEQRMYEPTLPCLHCKHLQSAGTQRNDADPRRSLRGWTCAAFPEEIPPSILLRETRHTEVLFGQEGSFVYTPERKIKVKAGTAVFTFDGDLVAV